MTLWRVIARRSRGCVASHRWLLTRTHPPRSIYNESVIAGGATADMMPQSIDARVQASLAASFLPNALNPLSPVPLPSVVPQSRHRTAPRCCRNCNGWPRNRLGLALQFQGEIISTACFRMMCCSPSLTRNRIDRGTRPPRRYLSLFRQRGLVVSVQS